MDFNLCRKYQMCPLLYLIYQVRIFSMQITNFLTNLEVKIVLNHARESFHANQISTKIAFTEAKLSHCLVFLYGFENFIASLLIFFNKIRINSEQISLMKKVNQNVVEGDQVIFSTGGTEIHLVVTRKKHISLELT